jgi:hypothetical protein
MAEDGFIDGRGHFNTATVSNVENLLGHVGLGVTVDFELKSSIRKSQSRFSCTYLIYILRFTPIAAGQDQCIYFNCPSSRDVVHGEYVLPLSSLRLAVNSGERDFDSNWSLGNCRVVVIGVKSGSKSSW